MGDSVRGRAFALLSALRLEDGRRWGSAAVEVQREDALAVLAPDSATPYHYVTRARGFSKTLDLAGVVVAIMVTQAPPGSRCYWLAADAEQGRIAIDTIAGFSARTSELRGALEIRSNTVSAFGSDVSLTVVAADAAGAFGTRPYLLCVDERANFDETESVRRLLEATTTGVAKRADARMVWISSAGSPDHSSFRDLGHARADPLWRVSETLGPPPWLDAERLAEQKRRLPESAFRRLFRNEWTSPEDRLANEEDVRAAITLDGPQPPMGGRRYVVAMDMAYVNDRAVGVVCHFDDGHVVLDRMEVWQGSRLSPVREATVEAWLVQAWRAYGRPLLRLDPWQTKGLAQRLRGKGVNVDEFTFSAQSVGRIALVLHRLLRDRLLDLPDDPELIVELLGVRLRETSPGVYRLDHGASGHDDRAVALAMAAEYLIVEGRPTPARWVNSASLSLGQLPASRSRRMAMLRWRARPA